MVGSHWKPSPCPMIILLKSITIPSLTPMVVLNQEKKQWLCLNPLFNGNGSWIFYSKVYFRAGLIFLYIGIYIHRPISKTKQAKKVKTFKWTQAPQRHQLSKCGPGCPEREESPKEEVRPWVLDHQGNGDDEAADHHEMEVKSYDHDEDDSA